MLGRFLGTLLTLMVTIIVVDLLYQIYSLTEIEKKDEHYYGDSTIMNGIDDSVNSHMRNYAESAESYYFTYLKFRRNINSENIPESIYISCNVHNLLVLDKPWYKNETDFYDRYVRYIPLSLSHPMFDIVFDMDKYLVAEVKKVIKYGLVFYEGGYEPNRDSDFVNEFIFDYSSDNSIDSVQIYWLEAIIDLAFSHDIEVTLLRMPVLNSDTPDQGFLKVANSFEEMGCDYLDVNLIARWPKNLFRDAHHLNEKGSVIMTDLIIGYEK